jgi:O-antigen/teichoic acid export membrane protein
MSKIKNILSLSVFTILSGAINYATYPILLKYLSLSDFALFSVFMNLITLFAIPALGFGYYILILAQRIPEDIKNQKYFWMRCGIDFSLSKSYFRKSHIPLGSA